MQKKEIRLLLTCCLGYYMKETIACFKASREYKVTVIGLDMNAMGYNLNDIDVFYQVPASTAPGYFDIVMDIARKERVDIVMPLHSKELIPFAEHRALFEAEGMLLAVPPLEGLRTANDKILAFRHMERMGLPVPRTLVTADAQEAARFLRENPDTTFVTKLADGCGARGFYVISDRPVAGVDDAIVLSPGDLGRVFDGQTQMLIQTYLPGMEYTTDMVQRDGRCVAVYTKACTQMAHGVIRQATVVDCPAVDDICIRFAESLGLSGNIGFDLKCDDKGNPMIIDVNPRITATVGLGRYAGLNLPLVGLDCLLGRDIGENLTARPGISIVRQIADFYFDENGRSLVIG